jgi:hypothetical protein
MLQISITLLWDNAPEMCALVVELANRNELAGSRFYRNEGVPKVRPFLLSPMWPYSWPLTLASMFLCNAD